jgi:DNA-binding NtrC family response regulator
MLLDECSFDAIVTDLRLHGMDGIELCRKARKSNPEVPIVLFTGYGDMNAAIAALRAGAADFVQKPADPDELADQLRLALERALDSARRNNGGLPDAPTDDVAVSAELNGSGGSTPWSSAIAAEPAEAMSSDDELMSLEELERRHIERVLRAVNGNKRAAARTLRVDRSTLYRKLARYRL